MNAEIAKKISDTWKNKSHSDKQMIVNKCKDTLITKYQVDNPVYLRRDLNLIDEITYDRSKVLYFHHDSDFTIYQLKLDVVSSLS